MSCKTQQQYNGFIEFTFTFYMKAIQDEPELPANILHTKIDYNIDGIQFSSNILSKQEDKGYNKQ